MNINCPKCGTQISVAVPRGSSFSAQYYEDPNVDKSAVDTSKHNIKEERDFNGYTLSYRWLSEGFPWFILIFAVFWNLISIPVFILAVLPAILKGEVFAFIFILHPLVGFFFFYFCMAKLLNRTIVRISNDLIFVNFAPLPWYGKKMYRAGDIDQFYVERYVSHHQNRRPIRKHKVKALLNNGMHEELVKGIKLAKDAIAIEQSLEKYLNIEDREVQPEN